MGTSRISQCIYPTLWTKTSGPGRVVGIATDYGLDGPRIEFGWGARFSALVQTDYGSHPSSCRMSTVSFQGVKCGRGVKLTPYRLLVQWSGKSRTIHLLPPWTIRPVQSLSPCKIVHFTFTVGKDWEMFNLLALIHFHGTLLEFLSHFVCLWNFLCNAIHRVRKAKQYLHFFHQ